MNKLRTLLTRQPKILLLLIAVIVGGIFATTNAIASEPVLMEGGVTSLNASTGTDYANTTNLKVDEVAQVQLWHHNREAPDTAVATNTVVKFNIPNADGVNQTVSGTSSSDNGNTINDTTTIKLSQDNASLQYEPGSAKFKYNKGAVDGRAECITGYDFPPADCFTVVSLPDSVITSGVNLDSYRGGPLEGCNAFHESVTVRVRSVAESIKVDKFVRHLGETSDDWTTSTDAKPGDTLEYMIRFENKGNTQLQNVSVGDNLPKYHDYIEGSTKLRSTRFPNGTSITSNNIVTGGIFVGDYDPASVGYVLIQTKLDPITAYEKCGDYELTNTALVGADNADTVYNTTQVTVTVECDEAPTPIIVCEGLTADKLTFKLGQKVTFTATGSAQNTTVDKYEFVIDGTTVTTTSNNTYMFTPTTAGTYKVQVYVIGADGQRITGTDCMLNVEVTEEEKVVVCNSLTAPLLILNIGESTKFTANATATNATITGYIFTVNGIAVQDSESNMYTFTGATHGQYDVAVTVKSSIGNVTGDSCVKTVTVVEEQTPVHACTVFVFNRNTVVINQTFVTKVTIIAKNGAEFKFATFTFGDGSEEYVTNNIKDDMVAANYRYKKAGTYKVNVAVTFNVNGEMITENSADCMGEMKVTETPRCDVAGKEHLPAGHKDCGNVQGAVTAVSNNVTTIPKTGAGSIAGIMAAITAAGSVAHRRITLRRK